MASLVELDQRSETTLAKYRSVQDKFGEFCRRRGIVKVTGICRKNLEDYIAHINGQRQTTKGREYAYATVNSEVTIIKQFANFLKEEGFVPERFRLKFPLSKPAENWRYCFTERQFGAMLELAKSQPRTEWLYPVIYSLGLTGLRVNELRGLRLTDICWESQQIVLKEERYSQRIQGGEVRRLKGKKSRSLPILPELLPILKSLPRHPDGFLFHARSGTRIRDRRVLESLQKHIIAPLAPQFPTPVGELGFADGVTHGFRHFFCSAMANRGVPEHMIMSWLGHRSSRMVRHYYTLHSEVARAAVPDIRIVPTAVAAGSPKAARVLTGDPQDACRDAQEERRKRTTKADPAQSMQPIDALKSVNQGSSRKTLLRNALREGLKSERRGGDSNPRYPCGYTGFRNRRVRPLCHLSGQDYRLADRESGLVASERRNSSSNTTRILLHRAPRVLATHDSRHRLRPLTRCVTQSNRSPDQGKTRRP